MSQPPWACLPRDRKREYWILNHIGELRVPRPEEVLSAGYRQQPSAQMDAQYRHYRVSTDRASMDNGMRPILV
jgi:hypothetical protein